MSLVLTDRVSRPMMITGALITVAGVGLFLAQPNDHQGSISTALLIIAMIVAGIALEVLGIFVHDRRHLRRGEVPHAMWGVDDARRPSRLGGPRS